LSLIAEAGLELREYICIAPARQHSGADWADDNENRSRIGDCRGEDRNGSVARCPRTVRRKTKRFVWELNSVFLVDV